MSNLRDSQRKSLGRASSKLLLSGFFLLLALGCYAIYRLLVAARG